MTAPRSLHVVAADDDPLMRRILADALQRLGHSFALVQDGELAWAAIARERPQLVVLDWQMPGLDGLEICRRIRADESVRDAFVLVVTGRDRREDLLATLDAGADDYLSKPVDPDQVVVRLMIAARRIALDEERRAAVAALARARWLAGVGQLAVAVQHEINNPLAVLATNVALFESDPTVTPAQRELSAGIAEQAWRIAKVVRRLTTLEDPRSVEYIDGVQMIDLSGDADA